MRSDAQAKRGAGQGRFVPDPTAATFQAIAGLLDGGRVDAAVEALRSLPPDACNPTFRDLRRALWMQALGRMPRENRAVDQRVAAALGALQAFDVNQRAETTRTNDYITASFGGPDALWAGAIALQDLCQITSSLRPEQRLALLDFALRNRMEPWATRLWALCQNDKGFRPTLHSTQLYLTCLGGNAASATQKILAGIETPELSDLRALLDVYAVVFLGGGYAAMFDRAAKTLPESDRIFLAMQMTQMRLGPSDLASAIAFAKTLGASGQGALSQAEMWQAAAQGDWAKVSALAAQLAKAGRSDEVLAYTAAAAYATGDAAQGHRLCDRLRNAPQTPWYIKDFAAQIDAIGRLQRDDTGLSKRDALPPVGAGRPAVQMLWVGPKLPMTAILSINSFLRTGWRVQLYLYDLPADIPDGVEVMDAGNILPARQVFREDANSGQHAGSLGAFSDLFRYALLAMKGGLWADTDTINLMAFDPTGCKIVSTETYAPGVLGLNGSLLAAPPCDPTVLLALERAQSQIAAQSIHFARIGPTLLAQLFHDFGAQDYLVLHPAVQNPIPCAETAAFFGKPEAFLRRIKGSGAINLHLYTETWRVGAQSLDAIADPTTAIGLLYDGLVNDTKKGARFLADLIHEVASDDA